MMRRARYPDRFAWRALAEDCLALAPGQAPDRRLQDRAIRRASCSFPGPEYLGWALKRAVLERAGWIEAAAAALPAIHSGVAAEAERLGQ